MRIESDNPYRIVDEWEIAAVTHTRTHTTLHPVPDAEGRTQQGIQMEGVLHFAVGARVRFTVEEVPADAVVAVTGDRPTEKSARPSGVPPLLGGRGPSRSPRVREAPLRGQGVDE